MRFNSLASKLLLWFAFAGFVHAGVPDAAASSDSTPPVEEMVVMGQMEIARRRAEVIRNLKLMGYREGKRKNGRTVYVPDTAYHPTVVLDDDAWMRIKRTPIRINPPGSRDNNLRYLWCLPPFTITPACIQAGGRVISPRRLAHLKEDVVRSTRYEMKQWQSAVISYAMDKRLGEEIPDMLDQIWLNGLPEGEDGPVIADPAGRRAAILQFWASRSCVSEGEQARAVVSGFVEHVIQLSENPASTDEIVNANQEQRCTDTTPLELPQVP